MTEPGPRACPQCGNLQGEGDFCENCGAQMFVGEGPAGFPPAAPPEPPPAAPSAAAAAAAVQSPPPQAPPPQSPPPQAAPAPQPPPPQQAPADYSQPSYGQPQYAPQPQPQPQPQYGGPSFGGPAPPRGTGTGFFGSLFDFSFTSFVTPKIIKVIYIVVLVVVALAVLGIIIAGFAQGVGTGLFFLVIVAPIAAIFYLLMARLWLEVVVVLFRVEEHLAELVKKS